MNTTASILTQAALLIVSPQCFDEYFVKFNFLNGKLVDNGML